MIRNNKVMHQTVKCGRVMEPVGEASTGLYTKLRKTRTFEMDVIQKLHMGKLSNLAHIILT